MKADVTAPHRREPALNAPWTVLALVAALLAAHAGRLLLGVGVERFALTAEDLARGRWWGLATHLFVHGGWAHVLVNGGFTLAFGAPAARFLGRGARGAAAFFAFFLTCGALAGLGYAGVLVLQNLAGAGAAPWSLVGASGAASGLLGAAARLIEGRGRLGSMTGRTVVAISAGWIGVNAVLGLTGLTPGAGGLPVAWPAHILGYAAGLLLIGPFAAAAGVRRREP